MKKVLSGVLVVLVLVALVACGSNAPVVGTWKLDSVSAFGQEFSVAEFSELSEQDMSAIEMEIKSNGTATLSLPGDDGGTAKWKEVDGGYEISDSTMTAPLVYDADSDTVSMEISGVTMIFVRA